jgi:prepilin-type N-terminal cleavage/methylation domain-containing protein
LLKTPLEKGKSEMKTQTNLARYSEGRRGFTLLELLVVVAILAIIGGAALTSLDGLDFQAAKGVATNSIASVENTVRTFTVLEGRIPNNLETLMAATPDTPVHVPALQDSTAGVTAGTEAKAGLLGSKLAGKFAILALSNDQIANLKSAIVDGKSTVAPYIRCIDLAGNDNTTADLTIKSADGGNAQAVGPIGDITIPMMAFDAPRPGNGRNRGRGFAINLTSVTTGLKLMVWSGQNPAAPQPLYNNVKVGANPAAVLVGLGIGNYSDVVSTSGDGGTGQVGESRFAHAPFYGAVGKNEYPNYILLVDVSQSPAKFVAAVDPRGDFLAEEFAESTGQKQ